MEQMRAERFPALNSMPGSTQKKLNATAVKASHRHIRMRASVVALHAAALAGIGATDSEVAELA